MEYLLYYSTFPLLYYRPSGLPAHYYITVPLGFPLLTMERISQIAKITATIKPINPKMGMPFTKGGILAFTIKDEPMVSDKYFHNLSIRGKMIFTF